MLELHGPAERMIEVLKTVVKGEVFIDEEKDLATLNTGYIKRTSNDVDKILDYLISSDWIHFGNKWVQNPNISH